MPQRLLVLGTNNRKKARELVELLAPLGVTIKSLADFTHALTVNETGDTFAANAALKAAEQAVHLGQWVLGEDSGICVDALRGSPGVYSARYSGPEATDESNNRQLLTELGQTPLERRTAHYVCSLALADPAGKIRCQCEAQCHGRIRFEPAGTAGFGYDPLFEIAEYHQTCAQLGEIVKSVLSHRARAIEKLLPLAYQIDGLGRPL